MGEAIRYSARNVKPKFIGSSHVLGFFHARCISYTPARCDLAGPLFKGNYAYQCRSLFQSQITTAQEYVNTTIRCLLLLADPSNLSFAISWISTAF